MIEFHNPYEHDLVNFLQICIKHDNISIERQAAFFSFNPESDKNNLIELFAPEDKGQHYKVENKFFIGKFTGRGEALHTLVGPGNSLFAFVIQALLKCNTGSLN